MAYPDLNALIHHSASTRQYFLSLPVEMQMELHLHNDSIHTAAQLRLRAERLEKRRRQMKLGGFHF